MLHLWQDSTREAFLKKLQAAPHAIARIHGLSVAYPPVIALLPYEIVNMGKTHVSGVLDRESKTILIAGSQPSGRQRFTLGHELGHFFLHKMPQPHRDTDAPKKTLEEREANWFASELLMPSAVVKESFLERFIEPICSDNSALDYWFGVAGIRLRFSSLPILARATLVATVRTFYNRTFIPMAEEFNVSEQAMAMQLVDLGLVR